jgi:hypothetical protein
MGRLNAIEQSIFIPNIAAIKESVKGQRKCDLSHYFRKAFEHLNVTSTKDGCSTVLIIRGDTTIVMVNEYIAMVAVIKTLILLASSTFLYVYVSVYIKPPLSHSYWQSLPVAPTFHFVVIHHPHISTLYNIHGLLPTTISQNVHLWATSFIFESVLLSPSFLAHLRSDSHNNMLDISITISTIIK